MLRTRLFGTLLTIAALAAPAQAHFVWLKLLRQDQGPAQVQVYFGEAPEPGEPHLIGKIAQTKVWARGLDGKARELKVAPAANKDLAALVASGTDSSPACIEATCDYGLYERGPAAILLQYDAKHLHGDWTGSADKLARSERLTLDVVPTRSGEKLDLQVLYRGKPSAGSEVVVVDPQGEQETYKADAEGRVSIAGAKPGQYAVRGSHIEPTASGERNGKKYAQTWYYGTLTFDLPAVTTAAASAATSSATPSQPGEKAASTKGEVPAPEALRRARVGRAAWADFPGFTAELTVAADGKQITGKASIDSSGVVSVELPASPVADWVEEQLNSMVQHRMPDGEINEGVVAYTDQDLSHPLGRKIELGDTDLKSAYRLKDDVIMEVNRSMGPQRFTISVLAIERNAEHKYLPTAFTMNFYDSASGELKLGLTYWNEWQRVGKFDLPKKIVEIKAAKGGSTTREILFANCKLNAAEAAAAK